MSYSADEIKAILTLQEDFQKIIHNPRTGIDDINPKNNFLYRNKEHDLKAGLFKIGAFYTYVPPSKISITQRLQNDQVILLRAPGSMKKMGKTLDITINLEVLFPNLAAINENLRPIIAQFIRTPFVPIENVHVQDILIPDVKWTQVSNDEDGVRLREPKDFERRAQEIEDYVQKEMNRNKVAWENSLSDAYQRLDKLKKEYNELLVNPNIKGTEKDKSIKLYETQISDIKKEIRELSDMILKYNTTDRETYIYNNINSFKNKEEYQKEYNENRMYKDKQIPVALESIQLSTIPGYSELIQANISLKVFNNIPYNPTFEFVKDAATAAKQVEFFGHLGNYQYPIEALRLRGIPLYDEKSLTTTNLSYTKNLSESEPFIAYISPLLTGTDYTLHDDGKESVTIEGMYDKITGALLKPIEKTIKFNSPFNWLRKAETNDFNKIHATFIVSDKERSLYNKISTDLQNEISQQLNDLIKNIVPLNNTIGRNLSLFWKILVVDTFSLTAIRKSLNYYFQEVFNEVDPKTLLSNPVIVPDNMFLRNLDNNKTLEISANTITTYEELTNQIKEFLGKEKYEDLINQSRTIFNQMMVAQYFARNGKLERYLFNIDTSESGKDARKTVITGVTAGMVNMLAPIPMEAMPIPTYQHLGRSDWNIELNIQTCDTHLLRTLMDIKDKLYTNNSNKKIDPDNLFLHEMNSIHLDPDEGNGFFKIIGVNNVIINGIRFNNIETKPGWFNFAISLQQNDIDPIKYEELTYMNSIDENVIQTITDLFMKNYTWKHPEGHYDTLTKMYPIYADIYVPQMRRYGFQRFFNIFYGDYNRNKVESLYFTDSLENNINKVNIPWPKLTTKDDTKSGITTILSGKYGPRNNGFHYGVDLTVKNNQPNVPSIENYLENTYIEVPLDGIVVWNWAQKDSKGKLEGYGNRVIIKHNLNGKTVYTLYAHLKEVFVDYHQFVSKGTQIGIMGNTGSSVSGDEKKMNPHLHFEIFMLKNEKGSVVDRTNRKHINPETNSYDVTKNIDYVISKYEYSDKERIIGDKEIEFLFAGSKTQINNRYKELANQIYSCIVKSRGLSKLDEVVFKNKDIYSFEGVHELITSNFVTKDYTTFALSFPEINKSTSFDSMYNTYNDNIKTLFDIANQSSEKLNKIYDIYIRSLVVSYINAYPQEATKMYNDYMDYLGRDHLNQNQILPAWYTTYRAPSEHSPNYLTNYNDLDLPIDPVTKSFTPADFYFRKNYEMTDFTALENDILSNSDNIRYDWMLQYKESLYFLLGTVQEELSSLTGLDGKIKPVQHNIEKFKKHLAELQKHFKDKGTILNDSKNVKDSIDKLAKEINSNKNLDEIFNNMSFSPQFLDLVKYIKNDYIDILKGEPNNIQSYNVFVKNYKKISKIFQNAYANKELYEIKNLCIIKNLINFVTILDSYDKGKQQRDLYLNHQNATGSDNQTEMINEQMKNQLTNALNDINAVLGAPNTSLLGIVTPYSLLTTQDIIARTKVDYEFIKGNNTLNNMERAFPTCLLYFIEEDDKSWKKLDDFYNYNGIVSCKVVKSKDNASDLCELVISNITGNLTDPSSVANNENQLKDQSKEEQNIKSMFISEGTTIMIKMGYNANPELLPRVFMGKIISIEYGEQIFITAQSFGAELLEYVNGGANASYGTTSACRTHGDIIVTALHTMDNMLHFGSKSIFEILGFSDTYDAISSMSALKNNGIIESYFWDKYSKYRLLKNFVIKNDIHMNFNVFDPRMENIYLPVTSLTKNDTLKTSVYVGASMSMSLANFHLTGGVSLFSDALKLLGFNRKSDPASKLVSQLLGNNRNINNVNNFQSYSTAGKIFFNINFDWVIPENTTLWDLLQEIKLYHDDYIVTVLPYNDFLMGTTRDTVYIGPRKGFYKYTDIFDTHDKFIKQRKRVEDKENLFKQVNESSKTRQEVIDKLNEFKTILSPDYINFRPFTKTQYGDFFKLNGKNDNNTIKRNVFNQTITDVDYKVIDGDSIIDLNNNVEYRYLGTDTYETVFKTEDPVILREQENLGTLGKKVNYLLLKLGIPTFITDGQFDMYGRPLVRAYVEINLSKNADFIKTLHDNYKKKYNTDFNIKDLLFPFYEKNNEIKNGDFIDIASVINDAGLNRTYRDYNIKSNLFKESLLYKLIYLIPEDIYNNELADSEDVKVIEESKYEKQNIEDENLDRETLKEINIYLGNLKEILLEDFTTDFLDDVNYSYGDLINKLISTLKQNFTRWNKNTTFCQPEGAENFIVNRFNNEKDVYLYEDYLGNIKGIDESYKPVVNYYIIDSANNIIKNDIRASSEELYNRLILKYPLDPTNSKDPTLYHSIFTVDDHIDPACISTFTSVQRNIDRASWWLAPTSATYFWEAYKCFNQKARVFPQYPNYLTVGYNLLAECMRPMYRGSLTIIGHPTIKPYDSIILSDAYKDMKGPIEVDTVVHEYSPNGLITTITPSAVIKTNDPGASLEYLQRSKMKIPFMYIASVNFSSPENTPFTYWSAGASFLGFTGLLTGILTGSTTFLVGGPILMLGAAWFATSLYMKHFDAFMCRDCVNLIGLWYRGLPMSAGMEGAYRDSYEAYKNNEIYNLLDDSLLFKGINTITGD